MSDDMRSILQRVAAGELTPEQALHAMDAAGVRPDLPVTPPTEPGEPISALTLRTSYRSVELIADPAVAQVLVAGEHTAQIQDGVLTVTTSGPLDEGPDPQDDEGRRAGWFAFGNLPKTLAWAKNWKDRKLVLRVRPDLPVTLDLTGTDAKIVGLTGGVEARVVASAVKAERLGGRLDLHAVSSSVKASAQPVGASKLYAESSSMRVTLLPGTGVTINAVNRMGRLVLTDAPGGQPLGGGAGFSLDGDTSRVVVGHGEHPLAVEAVMSSVTVGTQAFAQAGNAGDAWAGATD